CLEAIQEQLVRGGTLCRTTINARVNRIRRVLEWAARKRLVPVEVLQSVATVPGLQRGRTAAPEPERVLPAADRHIDATLPFLPSRVGGRVERKGLTGCRPGEALAMRAIDLSTPEKVWTYRPASHKNEHRGLDRIIFLGPQAQEVLKPFLTTSLEA